MAHERTEPTKTDILNLNKFVLRCSQEHEHDAHTHDERTIDVRPHTVCTKSGFKEAPHPRALFLSYLYLYALSDRLSDHSASIIPVQSARQLRMQLLLMAAVPRCCLQISQLYM